MSKPRIANSACRPYVQECRVFKGNNLWGEWYEQGFVNPDGSLGIHCRYVVYSYRYTWPLYVYDRVADTWFENESQYSQTTSRHRNQCRPTGVQTVKLKTEDMLIVADKGVVGLVEKGVM